MPQLLNAPTVPGGLKPGDGVLQHTASSESVDLWIRPWKHVLGRLIKLLLRPGVAHRAGKQCRGFTLAHEPRLLQTGDGVLWWHGSCRSLLWGHNAAPQHTRRICYLYAGD
jgi:hypothetical protein